MAEAATDVTGDVIGAEVDGLRRQALLAGGIGLGLTVLVALVSVQRLFESYLVAYLFWLNVACGCFPLLLLQHLTGGAWGLSIRRILEAGTRTVAPMALLFLPIAVFGLPYLFIWARPEVVAHDAILQYKSGYLNVEFFWVRAAFYFAVWIGTATLYSRWADELDRTGDPLVARRMEQMAGPAIVAYALTVTFASFDWVMSLDPHWFSHIFGALYGIRQLLAAFAFVIAVLVLLADREPFKRYVGPDVYHDLGKFLLAFVMVWAYFAFSQFLIIWAGNLPEEITWYLNRREGGWGAVGLAIILLHFALPFVLLLSRNRKRNPKALARVAVLVFGMRFVDMLWVVVPNFDGGNLAAHILTDLIAVVGVGGIWIWLFVGQLKGRPLLPFNDPYFAETMAHDEH